MSVDMETGEITYAPAMPFMSGSIGELAGALAKAQADFPPIVKDKTAGGAGSYTYKYADLSTILDAVGPVLTKHGLAVSQLFRNGSLVTLLAHTSGEWLCAEMGVPNHVKDQDLGKSITYRRRYSIQSILGVASEDDTDGAAEPAQASAPRSQFRPPAQAAAGPKITNDQKQKIAEAIAEGWIDKAAIKAEFGAASAGALTRDQAEVIIGRLDADPGGVDPETIPF
jgi:hypothetical protein